MPSFDTEKAKAAGYSDQEIAEFLNARPELKPTTPLQSETPDTEKQQKLVQELETSGVDPAVVGPQKTKLELMQKGTATKDMPFSLQPVGREAFDVKGERIAEDLAPKVGPHLAAAAGTAFALLPNIAEAAVSIKGMGAAKKGFTAAGEALAESTVGKAVRYTGEKGAAELTEKIAALPLKQTAKKELALGVKKTAQEGIQAAEKKAGIGLKTVSSEEIASVLKTPEKVAKYADRTLELANKGMFDQASPKILNNTRETIKAALADKTLPQGVKIKLMESQKVVNEAIAKNIPEVGEELSKFKDISKVIEELPSQFKREKQSMLLALKRMQNLAKEQARIRWKAGAGAVTAATALAGRKVLNVVTGGGN